jgi:hypothetical protein
MNTVKKLGVQNKNEKIFSQIFNNRYKLKAELSIISLLHIVSN